MRSDIVKKGATRCAHRSLFHANGYGPEDLKKPLIGICNSFNEIIPGISICGRLLRPLSSGLLQQVVRRSSFRPLAFAMGLRWDILA